MAVRLSNLDVDKKSTFIERNRLSYFFPTEIKPMSAWLDEEKKKDEFEQLIYFISSFYDVVLHREGETWTPDFQVFHRNFVVNVEVKSRLKKGRSPEELEQEALFSIVAGFSQMEKVKSIYTQKYREEIQMHLLLAIDQYDRTLMETLLGIEYDIRKKYPSLVFEFFYPPAGSLNKSDFIHPQAQCIYTR